MARPKAKAPARRYHISGQSVVTIAGRDFYLGKHDSPESIARYAALITVYQQNGLSLPDDFDPTSLDAHVALLLGVSAPQAAATHQTDQPILVRHVTGLFREHIAEKYKNTPSEKSRHDKLCDRLDKQFGDVAAEQFGPVKLKAFRKTLVDEGFARKYVNRLTNCVVAIFRHAVAGELIDATKVAQLKSLEPLRKGQTTAREVAPVVPVPIGDVRKTAELLSPVVKAMLRIQVATGARPKEICIMKPCDIDRSGDVWVYRLSQHKTDWTGKPKAIPLVGDARDAVTEYLQRDPNTYCFSPAEAMAWRRAIGTANRQTPLNQGNRPGSNRKANPKRTPRDHYTTASYYQAITRAAKRMKVPKWTPYQIRHLTATEVRAALGIEDARALLGHSTALMTAHYARESIEAATRAAKAAPKL
ncbi:tyrosine-type recombinase/integrase [Roseiconus nitratireducens]|uniref:Tyrosine-type recombinase/integrase n=1 Tax=Roseiconus nitratireducens TaxID=2605748 RepID=A0A5M6DEY3_9BACT|nr:tyrosine-type recombinase/integrase [Roseiconus nitratireducens]KAA5546028.1 tyrosine-type recombinase/integrase [Roseiconus nitratireducens]